MTTTNNSTNPVNTLVQSFQDTIPANLDQQRKFQVQGFRVLWAQIAEAFFVAQNIRKEIKTDLAAALKERGINEAKKDANPYLPIVKMLYGEWKTVSGSQKFITEQQTKDVTVFEPNRSAEKYACVFRYFNKRKDQFPDVQSIIDHIEATVGHLKGIEETDRKDHKKPSSKAKPDDSKALARGLSVRGAMEIGSRDDVKKFIFDLPDDAKQGQIWFTIDDNGKVYLMGFKPLENNPLNDLAKKRGKTLLETAAQQAIDAELDPAE